MMKIIKIVSLVLFIAPMFANASIVIDGKLDEEEWVDAQTIDDFFVINPFSLDKPDLNTKVLIHQMTAASILVSLTLSLLKQEIEESMGETV